MPGSEHDDRSDDAPRRPDDPHHDEPTGEEGRRSRFSRITKVLMDRGEDARSVLGSVWDSSDRARAEMTRLIAREVRHYLEALKLTEDLRDFATNHTLEVQASFRLKPIPKDEKTPAPKAPAKGEEPPKE